MKIEVSNGEIIDKYTILMIKSNKIKDELKLKNIENEKNSLIDICKIIIDFSSELFQNLLEINQKLWIIEDKIREKEKNKEFDEEFISLARSVYKTNDIRAEIKKNINLKTESKFIEEKSYEKY